MQYSAKLKKAMEEIKAILIREDIAGFVAIHTPGFGEHLTHIGPSYSCAKIDEANQRIQITAKKEDFGGSLIKKNTALADTANMFRILSDITGSNAMMLIETSETLDRAIDSKHGPSNNSSHTSQNN